MVNDSLVSNWPFPTEDNPLKPWTPEDHKKWAEDKLKDVPESPLMGL
jgi:hypothetical protein